MSSQADQVILYLESGYELTPIDALNLFGVFRLAARIKDLRSRGYAIETLDREANGKRFAAYRLSRPIQHNLFASSELPRTAGTVPAGMQAGAI